MQIISYSKFRANIKSYIDDCISNDEPIIINRNSENSVVLLPLKKYKELDENEVLQSNREYEVPIVEIFKRMKAKSKKILSPETYKKYLV